MPTELTSSDIAVSRRQAAIRLLAVIDAAAQPPDNPEIPAEVVGIVESQMKLQALDFWMRYPDYLADELLNEYERSGDVNLLDVAGVILDSREPDLRRLPMIRYWFGAFEPIDDSLALLGTYDYVRIRRKGTPGQNVQMHTYWLTESGRDAMNQLASSAPELAWYKDRAALVVQIAGSAGGAALKERQYKQAEYSGTKLRDIISPITKRVAHRLLSLRKELHA